MKTTVRLLLVAVLAVAVIGSETYGAAFEVPNADGWYTWQVEASDGSDLQIYARMAAGRPVSLLARGPSICFSGVNPEAVDLGRVAVDQSISWLHGHIYPLGDLTTEVIMLISLHAGELPVEILEQLLAVAG